MKNINRFIYIVFVATTIFSCSEPEEESAKIIPKKYTGGHDCANIKNDYLAWAKRMTDAVSADQNNVQGNSHQGQWAMYDISSRIVRDCPDAKAAGFSKSSAEYQQMALTSKTLAGKVTNDVSFFNKVISWW